MVVRIMADGQYRLDDKHRNVIRAIIRLDEELVGEVAANDEAGFHTTLQHLIEHIHHVGRVVPIEELIPSDLMIPAEDMSLAETREVLDVVG
jgi:hypothetical protein